MIKLTVTAYKIQSFKVFFFSILQFPPSKITLPRTTVLTNIAPPNRAPTNKEIFSFLAAKIEENTSGAPLPKANKVTPATVGDSFNDFDIEDNAGEKYESAVEPNK